MKKWLLTKLMIFGLVSVAHAAPQTLPDFTRLVEREGKAVVNISTTSIVRETGSVAEFDDEITELFRRFGFAFPPGAKRGQPREHQTHSLGSGFIVERDGFVLTNAHVVANATEITVKLADKRTFKAQVVGSDPRTDVALLKIDAKGLPKVNVGDVGKLKVGEWVVAIGAPFGLEHSVTAGIVSAKGRNLPDENYVPFIQTDAAINPGNSGGPLFNMNGEVVGVNSQIYSRSGGYMGLSFAIPIDVALQVAQELKSTGRVQRARMGVTIQDVSEALAKGFGLVKAFGALVSSVEKSGPADKGGIKAGDIILKFNDQTVTVSADLPRMVAAAKPGSRAKVEIWRDKETITLSLTLGELEKMDKKSAKRALKDKQQEENGRFGLVVSELNEHQKKELGVSFGLLVQEATGASAQAGLQHGDVIAGIHSREVTSFSQFRQALASLKTGESIPLRVIRSGQPLFLILTAPAQ